jgi:hypothetical protein
MKDWRFLFNVLVKALLLLLIANLLFMGLFSAESLGKLSLYNHLFPGRERFPFGENPEKSYNLSLSNLDAMFASHRIAQAKAQDEFRIILIGDSATWGTLLRPQETLAGQLQNLLQASHPGKNIQVYNLGYPTLSLVKDLLILDQAMTYQPDLILWLTTLESFPMDRQLDSPLLQQNAARVLELNQKYDLQLSPLPTLPSKWQATLISQRRNLADLLRLQLYGFMWGATGIDQEYFTDYIPAQVDLEADETFEGFSPPELPADQMAFHLLDIGKKIAGDKPIIFINEPILISGGENHDLRYNFYYPRWAYDQYRQMFHDQCTRQGWICYDEWDLLEPQQFTNSAIHLSAQGAADFAHVLQSNLDASGIIP